MPPGSTVAEESKAGEVVGETGLEQGDGKEMSPSLLVRRYWRRRTAVSSPMARAV
jgi:hypothetical protein